jgi:hypothetical protein
MHFPPLIASRSELFALLWETMEYGRVHAQMMWKSILRHTEENPCTMFIVYKLLKMYCAREWWGEQLLYLYHLQQVQARSLYEFCPSQEFCLWFLWQYGEDSLFSSHVCLTNEAGFTRNGILNFHSRHIWGDINLHSTIQSRHQQKFQLKYGLVLFKTVL